MIGRNKTAFSRRQAGFTLIEIMVTVGIIILLLGIGIVAGTRFIAEGKKEQTRSMLKGLMGAHTEFQAQRNQGSLNHDGNNPINWDKDVKNGGRFTSSERFVWGCQQIKKVEDKMMAALNSGGQETFRKIWANKKTGSPVNEIYDIWGTELEYRSKNDGKGTGPNSSVKNSDLPLSRAPFFVSAGPDKKFGTEDDISSLD